METVSGHFGLSKTQPELDFVDVPIDADLPLFIDPFAISQRVDRWSQETHRTLVAFFQRVVDEIRSGHPDAARELLGFLREPNETRLGFSSERPRGAGIGHGQSEEIFQALSGSTAVKTGLLQSLEECELMVEGVGRDKISDLTTNIIRAHLAEYTVEQCTLHSITTRKVPLGPVFDPARGRWNSAYLDLPVAGDRPILLVPKAIARYDPAYDHKSYYQHFVLEYLQVEHLDANSSLVRTLKSGRRVVTKKALEAMFPCTKENLFLFSKDHPEVLDRYRARLADLELRGREPVDPEDAHLIADALIAALQSIPAGRENASTYHKLVIGIVEFIFFPNLIYPRKEQEIHQGRKRIDIVMENGARAGIFHRLHDVRRLPCAYVMFECKNYETEVANPELDQLAGRFSPNRGCIGFLCCRRFEDREVFLERCRDTFNDDRGLILPLDDDTIFRWLGLIKSGNRKILDQELSALVDEICLS